MNMSEGLTFETLPRSCLSAAPDISGFLALASAPLGSLRPFRLHALRSLSLLGSGLAPMVGIGVTHPRARPARRRARRRGRG